MQTKMLLKVEVMAPGAVRDNKAQNRFELDVEGAVAFANYRRLPGTVVITHTRPILNAYGFYVAQDLTIDRAGDWLFENRPVQAFSTYFRLVDVTSHLADHYLDRKAYEAAVQQERAGAFGKAEEERLDREFARVLRPLYEQMDRTIAKYLARMDGRTLLVVCSDHGFRFFQGAYSHANPAQEPPDGVVFVAGPGVRKGQRLDGASVYDIAPTIISDPFPAPGDDGRRRTGADGVRRVDPWPRTRTSRRLSRRRTTRLC